MEEQNLLTLIEKFIYDAIDCKVIHDKVEVKLVDDGGFYVQRIARDGDTVYTIHVPKKLAKLRYLTKLTLLHELGHALFNELYYNDYGALIEIMSNMYRKKWFARVERFWYWNPCLRWVRRKLGWGFDIKYQADDKYDPKFSEDYRDFTRADNEFFCDYFAVFLKNWTELSRIVTH